MSQPSLPHKSPIKGAAFGLTAYFIWGFLPLYFAPLGRTDIFGQTVPPLAILAHRVTWSVLILIGVVLATGLWREVLAAIRSRRTIAMLICSTALVSSNWFAFTWCATRGEILQASLGYFIVPLLSTLLGLTFLREKMRPLQWLALALALAGVVYLAVGLGVVPKAGLALAVTWALYGLVRKLAPVNAVAGLSVETALLLPIALAYLWHIDAHALPGSNLPTPLLLYVVIGSGLLTTIPLLCFARAAKLLPLTSLGFLQYLGPTCQFLCAVYLGEHFSTTHAVAFALIWTAVAIYVADAVSKNYLARRISDKEAVEVQT